MSEDLTEKQRDLISQLPAAKSYTELGADLGIAKRTVQSRKQAINRKDAHRVYKDDEGVWRYEGPADVNEGPPDADEETADADNDAEDTAETPELDDLQGRAIRTLPATVDELGTVDDDLDGHQILETLREDGINVGYDPAAEKYYLADERSEQLRSQTHLSLSAKTKRAKQHLREEHALLDRLPETTPLSIDAEHEPRAGTETMVAAIGDLHFGDEYTDDRGRVVYDRDIAHDAVDAYAEKVITHKRQWGATFDECVIPILGDVATGTKVYDTQKNEIADLLAQQIKDGANALTRFVATLAEHFESVRVFAVVGNHGFQDPSAARGSNTDLVCYKWMQDALRREGYDNLELTIGDAAHHLNFDVRGWRFHIRHGQDGQMQVDETARSEADWRGWRDKHRFDVAIRGHYHVPSLHWVLNRYPVVTIPSPAPGGEFADRIGSPDVSTPADRAAERKLGYCFGVSEERRITDSRMTDAG